MNVAVFDPEYVAFVYWKLRLLVGPTKFLEKQNLLTSLNVISSQFF